MAKINTYPTVTPAIDDELLGTDVSDTGNDANGETSQFVLQALRDLFVKGLAQCYFQYTNTTTCTLVRKNGALIQIDGELHQIPAAGVTLGLGGLSPGTLYYVYAYDNAGTLTLEASPTGHAASTTAGNEGMRIKSGDDSRTLVGMIYTTGSTQFFVHWVISYWNPTRRVYSVTEGSAPTTSSTGSWVAIGTAVYFLYFSGHPIPQPTIQAPVDNTGANMSYLAAYLDGLTSVAVAAGVAATYESFIVHGSNQTPSEGLRYYRAYGIVNAGTATYGYAAGGVYMRTQVEYWG